MRAPDSGANASNLLSGVSRLESKGPAKNLLLAGLLFLALGTCGAPFRQSLASPTSAEAQPRCGSVSDFYKAHPQTRIWVQQGELTRRGRELVAALAAADADGLEASRYSRRVSEASLSNAFAQYLRDLAVPPPSDRPYYVDGELAPKPPCASALLDRAARAPSIKDIVERFQAPNLLAAAMRTGADDASPQQRQALAKDLALARAIGSPSRFVVVDTASQRLLMIDGNQVVGGMKVVVGKSGMDTPNMAGLIRYAVVNPYWDIPPDLVRHDVAPRVAASGTSYLYGRGYEAVSSYDASGVSVDPATVDWAAVSNGSSRVGIRQIPGPENMMGQVMFMFPNKFGIYLHDTPIRWVFSQSDRRLSHGCVRLEKAAALYQWLFRRPLADDLPGGPAARMEVAKPVPVYLLRLSGQEPVGIAGRV